MSRLGLEGLATLATKIPGLAKVAVPLIEKFAEMSPLAQTVPKEVATGAGAWTLAESVKPPTYRMDLLDWLTAYAVGAAGFRGLRKLLNKTKPMTEEIGHGSGG